MIRRNGYYTPDGKILQESVPALPLEFSRITSGFTHARFHPILQRWRAHKGIDYAAPTGTRVKATGDGIVELAGCDRGYGNVVMLRHQRSTPPSTGTCPASRGRRTRRAVSQGDVIGYVGSTGLATGPHLHYEFRINDVHQDPLTVAMPDAPPITPRAPRDFDRSPSDGTAPRAAAQDQSRAPGLKRPRAKKTGAEAPVFVGGTYSPRHAYAFRPRTTTRSRRSTSRSDS